MKLTTEHIRQIIKEELQAILDEGIKKQHRDKMFVVKYNQADIKLIPLSTEEVQYYKEKGGFFKHQARIKKVPEKNLKLTDDGFENLDENNLPGYYLIIKDAPLHKAAEKAIKNDHYVMMLGMLGEKKNDIMNSFKAAFGDLSIFARLVE